MADGRHLEKSRNRQYLRNGLTDFRKIWHGDANWASEPDRELKFTTFKKSKMAESRHLKNRKSGISQNGLTDLREIWGDDAY